LVWKEEEYSNDQLVTEERGEREKDTMTRMETVKCSTNTGCFHMVHRCGIDIEGDNLV
jgi:hypothetical protein